MLLLNENSMKPQKTTGKPKDPWLATRASHNKTPQVHGQNWINPTGKANTKSQTGEELKELRIKKIRAEIDFSIDKMVSYEKSVCFKYSKIWFNNGICRIISVLVCTIFEVFSCGNWKYCKHYERNQWLCFLDFYEDQKRW